MKRFAALVLRIVATCLMEAVAFCLVVKLMPVVGRWRCRSSARAKLESIQNNEAKKAMPTLMPKGDHSDRDDDSDHAWERVMGAVVTDARHGGPGPTPGQLVARESAAYDL